jgi:hypothetical protein
MNQPTKTPAERGAARIWHNLDIEAVIVTLNTHLSDCLSKPSGGQCFGPKEDNPMIGIHVASRYYDDKSQTTSCLSMGSTSSSTALQFAPMT